MAAACARPNVWETAAHHFGPYKNLFLLFFPLFSLFLYLVVSWLLIERFLYSFTFWSFLASGRWYGPVPSRPVVSFSISHRLPVHQSISPCDPFFLFSSSITLFCLCLCPWAPVVSPWPRGPVAVVCYFIVIVLCSRCDFLRFHLFTWHLTIITRTVPQSHVSCLMFATITSFIYCAVDLFFFYCFMTTKDTKDRPTEMLLLLLTGEDHQRVDE